MGLLHHGTMVQHLDMRAERFTQRDVKRISRFNRVSPRSTISWQRRQKVSRGQPLNDSVQSPRHIASAEGSILHAAQCCLNIAKELGPAIETKNGKFPLRRSFALIHFISAPLDSNNLPVLAQAVNRDLLQGLERGLELIQLSYFHDMPIY